MNTNKPLARLAIESMLRKQIFTTEKEASDFVLSASQEEIAQRFNAMGSLLSAIDVYAQAFNFSAQTTRDFINECLDVNDQNNTCRMAKTIYANMISAEIDEIDRFTPIVAADHIHDTWRHDPNNAARFFSDPSKKDKAFQYLPTAFIGTEEFSKDLRYAEAVHKYIGLDYDRQTIIAQYQNSCADYLAMGIELYGGLPQFASASITNDDSLSLEIKEKFADIDWVKEVVVPQLLEQGFGKDEVIMRMLSDKGLTPEVLSASDISHEEEIGHTRD